MPTERKEVEFAARKDRVADLIMAVAIEELLLEGHGPDVLDAGRGIDGLELLLRVRLGGAVAVPVEVPLLPILYDDADPVDAGLDVARAVGELLRERDAIVRRVGRASDAIGTFATGMRAQGVDFAVVRSGIQTTRSDAFRYRSPLPEMTVSYRAGTLKIAETTFTVESIQDLDEQLEGWRPELVRVGGVHAMCIAHGARAMIDEVAAAGLAHLGVSGLEALACLDQVDAGEDENAIVDGPAGTRLFWSEGVAMAAFEFGERATTWSGDALLVHGVSLPDSVFTPGRMLRDVLEHDLLNGLVVRSSRVDRRGTTVEVETPGRLLIYPDGSVGPVPV